MPAAGPRSLPRRLRTRRKEGEKGESSERACCGVVTHGRLRAPERGERGVGPQRCRHQRTARGSQLVVIQVQRGDLVALHRREERAHVHGAEHLQAEVHFLAARRLALDFDQRGAVRLDHLVLQARDQRLVVGVGERTAARHVALVMHLDLRVAVEGA
eukprot:scaffold35750_cov56-Phaeocystis_antarctica.AAC.6